MTSLQFQRANRTEKNSLMDDFTKSFVSALNGVFSSYSRDSTIYKHLMKLAEEELISVDSSIDVLASEFAMAQNPDMSKSTLNKLKKDTVSIGGTIKEMGGSSTNKALQSISNEFRRLSSQGMNTDDIRKTIIGTKNTGYSDGLVGTIVRSKDLTADTSNKLMVTATQQEEYEKDPDVIGYVWNTKFENTCTACMALSGKKYYYAKSGKKPLPPLHLNCNCYTSPIYSQESDKKTKEVQSFDEWSKDPANETELKESLGTSRYKLLTDGKLKIERFNSVGLEPLTLKEIETKSEYAYKKAGI